MISEQISKISHSVEAKGTITEVVEQLSKQLSSRGFGVLTNIDLQKKIKEKTGHDVGGCTVLDVCNTEHARKALTAHKEAVLSLPCRLAVYENAGKVFVSFYKLTESIKQLGFDDLSPLGAQVDAEVEGAMDSIAIN